MGRGACPVLAQSHTPWPTLFFHGFGFWDLGQPLEARETSEHTLDGGGQQPEQTAVSSPPGVSCRRGQQGDPAAQAVGLRCERGSEHWRESWVRFLISLWPLPPGPALRRWCVVGILWGY